MIPSSSMANTKYFSCSETKEEIRNFLAGSFSGFVCKAFEYPFDSIKTLQQFQPEVFKGPVDALSKTVRSHGFLALYQGLSLPLLGGIVENAVAFSAYGRFKHELGIRDGEWSSPWRYAVAGGGTGFFTAAMLTPIELVKCNLQIQQAQASAAAAVAQPSAPITFARTRSTLTLTGKVRYRGPVDATLAIIKKDGVRGLFRGHTACVLREVPGNFAWFGVYEGVLRLLCEEFGYATRGDVPLPLKAVAGAIGGVAYWAIPFPMDTVKTLMQTDERFRGKRVDEVFRAVGRRGWRALYAGLAVTCVRAAPEHFLIFFTYEWCEARLRRF